jgi:hypothetical protein
MESSIKTLPELKSGSDDKKTKDKGGGSGIKIFHSQDRSASESAKVQK